MWTILCTKQLFHPCRFMFERLVDAFLKTVFIPLVNLQLMLSKFDSIYLGAYASVSFAIFLVKASKRINENITSIAVVLQSSLLLVLCLQYEDENYWLLHLTILSFINHFAMKRISRKFDSVPQIDLSMISLMFLNIFLINSCFR